MSQEELLVLIYKKDERAFTHLYDMYSKSLFSVINVLIKNREEAEDVFRTALRKERFSQNSLFSYHFNGGWMEFMLQFDEQSRLRRIYIQHKDLKCKYELPITKL